MLIIKYGLFGREESKVNRITDSSDSKLSFEKLQFAFCPQNDIFFLRRTMG